MTDTDRIRCFHVHVYFDEKTHETARRVCHAVKTQFGVPMGHMHVKPVGPHPMGSCQLTIPADQFGAVLSWLALNREGLTVFSHPDTGEDLLDHRDRAIWMGEMKTLDLSLFSSE